MVNNSKDELKKKTRKKIESFEFAIVGKRRRSNDNEILPMSKKFCNRTEETFDLSEILGCINDQMSKPTSLPAPTAPTPPPLPEKLLASLETGKIKLRRKPEVDVKNIIESLRSFLE